MTQYPYPFPKQSPERFKLFYLGLAFACLVVMLAISIYVINRHSYRDLINYVEMNSERISDSIYYTEVDAISQESFNGRSNIFIPAASFDYLDTRIRDKYDQLDILKVSIYNINGTIIYSSDKKAVGNVDASPILASVLEQGAIKTIYKEHETIVDLVGEKRDGIDLAEVYVPIKHKNGQTIGVIAVYSDVAHLKRDNRHQLYSSVIILTCAILVISLLSYAVIIRETSELKEAYQLLQSLATTDGLTGVSNRSQLLTRAEELFAMIQRTRDKIGPDVGLGMIMIDVDHFKEVNDTYGHLVGDAVLRELAERIGAILRQYDVFGRYGGEEFLLVLPTITADEVLQVATRVCSLVREQPFTGESAPISITTSVGATWTCASETTLDQILSTADQLLYDAKNKGRNQVVFRS